MVYCFFVTPVETFHLLKLNLSLIFFTLRQNSFDCYVMYLFESIVFFFNIQKNIKWILSPLLLSQLTETHSESSYYSPQKVKSREVLCLEQQGITIEVRFYILILTLIPEIC